MKALLPVFCRPMGYAVMALALILPFIMAFMGRVTDSNLLFYKECSKLLMMMDYLCTNQARECRNGGYP